MAHSRYQSVGETRRYAIVVVTMERDRLATEARLAGLRQDTPTLAAVDRRRTQIIGFAVMTLLGIAAAASIRPDESLLPVSLSPVRPLLGALAVGVVVYAADRERRLRRLTRMLVDERALSAALMLRLDEVRAMLDVAKAMNSTAALETILSTVVRASTSILGGQSGMLLFLDGDSLHVVASAGAAPMPGTVLPLEGSPSAHVALTWEMVMTSATVDQPATLYMPVRHGPELLGVLVLAAHPARPFGDYDLRAAELFAEQAACAIAQTHRAHAAKWQQEEQRSADSHRQQASGAAAAELRNPIASMIAATKMLQRPKITDTERLDLANVLERQTNRLSKSVEDLLAAQG